MADHTYKFRIRGMSPDDDFAFFQEEAEAAIEDFFEPHDVKNVALVIDTHQGSEDGARPPWADVTATYHKDTDDKERDEFDKQELTGGRSIFGAYGGPPPF